MRLECGPNTMVPDALSTTPRAVSARQVPPCWMRTNAVSLNNPHSSLWSAGAAMREK
jgi:hypothetical protein